MAVKIVGRIPPLSESLRADLRALIYRHEPVCNVDDALERVDSVLVRIKTEDGRVRWLNGQLDIYRDAESLFGEVG